MHAKTQQEGAVAKVIEQTKLMDLIYIKYGINIVQLKAAAKEHGLNEDPDIKILEQANAQQVKNMAQAKRESAKLSPQQSEELKECCKKAGAPFMNLMQTGETVISFDQFLGLYTVIIRLTIRFFNQSNVQHKIDRRALLKAKKEKEYQLMCQ